MAESLAARQLRVPGRRIAVMVLAYVVILLVAVLLVTAVFGPPPLPLIFVFMIGGGILGVSLRRQRIELRPEGLGVLVGGFGVPTRMVAWSACSPFRLSRRLAMGFAEADGAPGLPAGQWGMPSEEFVALLNRYRDAAS